MGRIMKTGLCLLLFFVVNGLYAQTDIDTLFSGAAGSEGKLIKKDSTGYYYRLKHYPNRIYYYSNKGYFKLFNNRYQLLLSGQITQKVCSQLVYKGDKWTSYYTNGQIKTEGFYESNQAVGTWRHYYSNGQLAKTYAFVKVETDSVTANCRKGPYEEYYPNGRVKITGNYTVTFDSIGIYQSIYDSTGNVIHYETCRYPVSRHSGTWLYYKPTGELQRKETY
jgi:antitoxin component YwqK of YwqJK toxin-antitoxin module